MGFLTEQQCTLYFFFGSFWDHLSSDDNDDNTDDGRTHS